MKDFKDYFSFEHFMEIANISTENQINKDNNNKDLQKEKEKTLLLSIYNFLQDFNKENGLSPLANSVGHKTNFGYFWNNFIANNINKKNYSKEDNLKSDTKDLENLLYKELFFPFYVYKDDFEKISPIFWQERYNNLTTKLNNGDFDHYTLPDSFYCFDCGCQFKLCLKKWQPQLLEKILVHKDENWLKNKYEYNPADECAVPKKINLEIELTTGNLLITDWFRIEEFTKIVNPNGIFHNKYDINSSLGRINQAKEYTELFNFISTPSGGMPSIFKNGNELIIGSLNENENITEFEKKYENKGQIDCQLRAITIIDYEQIVKLLTVEENNEESTKTAKDLINKYIEENKREILNIKVEPGKYTFEFSGNYYDLKDHLEENLPTAIKPFLVLKNTESYIKTNNIEQSEKKKPKMR